MKIPILNIYYLLCYAWGKAPPVSETLKAAENCAHAQDLLAKVLVMATSRLMKRGLEQDYRQCQEVVAGIKGKLLLSQTLKSDFLALARTACEYDDLTTDTPNNRILKFTLWRLMYAHSLNADLREQCGQLYRRLPASRPEQLTRKDFNILRLHRNNDYYRLVVDICLLIFEIMLPMDAKGEYRFVDYSKDGQKLHEIFERFVRNFYRIEMPEAGARREEITWCAKALGTSQLRYLPTMETDTSLTIGERRIIIETKFYEETLQHHFGTDKVHSAHLYQLFAYLKNIESKGENYRHTEGILLYPVVGQEFHASFKMSGHKVKVATVDLNREWREIDSQMRALITDVG